MALGDMLGSAKLNGMAGHSAICGDRFSLVKGPVLLYQGDMHNTIQYLHLTMPRRNIIQDSLFTALKTYLSELNHNTGILSKCFQIPKLKKILTRL